MDLENVKKKLKQADEEKVRLEEKLKGLKEREKELEEKLKEHGIESSDDIEPRLEGFKEELKGLMGQLHKIEKGELEPVDVSDSETKEKKDEMLDLDNVEEDNDLDDLLEGLD